MRLLPPPPEGGDPFWITPGGGLEPGETVESGLRRELREEVGLEHFVMGPLVWRRQHTFDWGGKRFCQREQYHVVHVARFEPRMSDALEMHVVDRFRWWPVPELAHAPERLTPLSLAAIVARYLTQGPPPEPPDVEVLVDEGDGGRAARPPSPPRFAARRSRTAPRLPLHCQTSRR